MVFGTRTEGGGLGLEFSRDRNPGRPENGRPYERLSKLPKLSNSLTLRTLWAARIDPATRHSESTGPLSLYRCLQFLFETGEAHPLSAKLPGLRLSVSPQSSLRGQFRPCGR